MSSPELPHDQAGDKPASGSLPRSVVALAWVSFFADVASDMIYPLLPALIASLGGGAMAVGAVEGVGETVGAVLKVVAGRAADRAPRKKPLVALGYAVSAAARPLFALAAAPWHAAVVRGIDRVGKGLRGPPRDAIVAAAVAPERRGYAFGVQRMMDNLGAVAGPLVAWVLLGRADLPLRKLFWLSAIPGAVSVLIVLAFVREGERAGHNARAAGDGGPLPARARRYLAAVALFALAGAGDLFLMRRLTDLGLAQSLVPIAWLSLQLVKGLTNVPGGRASDRFGRRRVLVAAWLVYAAAYAGFALAISWAATWIVLALYGFHYGLAEGGQRALLADLVPEGSRGRAYGWQLALEGGLLLPANLAFGALYDAAGAATAFAATAAVALVAAIVLAADGTA